MWKVNLSAALYTEGDQASSNFSTERASKPDMMNLKIAWIPL
jgi:hypothetical protein